MQSGQRLSGPRPTEDTAKAKLKNVSNEFIEGNMNLTKKMKKMRKKIKFVPDPIRYGGAMGPPPVPPRP